MPMRTMHRVNGLMFQDLLRYEKKAREMTEQKDVLAQGGAGNPFEEIKKLADAPDPYSPAPERLSRIMAICDAAVSGSRTPAGSERLNFDEQCAKLALQGGEIDLLRTQLREAQAERDRAVSLVEDANARFSAMAKDCRGAAETWRNAIRGLHSAEALASIYDRIADSLEVARVQLTSTEQSRG